jgi:hypothetical protein
VLKYGRKELMTYFDLEKRYLATRDLWFILMIHFHKVLYCLDSIYINSL